MWRFKDLQQAFQVILKPNPNENSPFILVIKRENDEYIMDVWDKDSEEAQNIMDKSREMEFFYKSKNDASGRYYGWF